MEEFERESARKLNELQSDYDNKMRAQDKLHRTEIESRVAEQAKIVRDITN